MAAPTLDSDHPGLRVLAEVAGILASGLAAEDALSAAAAALRRGLRLRRCRLWLRNPDGAGYHPVVAAGGARAAHDGPPHPAHSIPGVPDRAATPTSTPQRCSVS